MYKKTLMNEKISIIPPYFPNIPARYALFLAFFLLFLSTSILSAQSGGGTLNRRLVWRPSEHTIGYSVEIDRLAAGLTEAIYVNQTLKVGYTYRFR